MKRLFLIVCVIIACPGIQAQEQPDSVVTYAGLALRADMHVPLEADLKYLRRNAFSAGLRITGFHYTAWSGEVKTLTYITQAKHAVNFTYEVSGITLKPGWVPLKLMHRKAIVSLGLYGVITRSVHEFTLSFSDIAGVTKETYERTVWSYGLEADWHAAIRVSGDCIIGFSLIGGLKEKNVNVFGDVVNGMYSYTNYTPAQGYGGHPVYINALLTLGFVLQR
jgi:hypothetical protein